MSGLSEDDITLAAEYVLGLLDAADEASANARIAIDAAFAAEVGAWRTRLQPTVNGYDTPVAPHVWDAIEASLPLETGQEVKRDPARIWQILTGLSATAAAVLAMLLLQQPAPVTTPTQPPVLIAALGSDTERAALTANYDASKGAMLLTPVSLDTGKLYPELWIIPADGKARSLGIVKGDKPSTISIPAELRQYVSEGATLAITPEPEGGAPGRKATGPVIASGKIVTI